MPSSSPSPALRFAAAFLLATSGIAAQPAGPPPAKVVLAPALSENLARLRSVTAELRPALSSRLAAEQEGLVRVAAFDAGSVIEAGATLVELDDTLARLTLDQATADVAAAQAEVTLAEAEAEKAVRDRDRAKTLVARSVESTRASDDAETVLRMARARIEQRRAALAAAEVRLARNREVVARMKIVAPFAGVVTMKQTEIGQWLRPGDVVAEVVALDQIEAWLDVPEGLVGLLAAPDAGVRLRFPAADLELEAKAGAIVPRADPRSRLVPVRVVIDNTAHRLIPGTSVTALVPAGGNEPVITVPKDAIRRDDSGPLLYYDGGGVARLARVTTLFAVGERIAIIAPGVEAGTQVIVEGNERVFPGQPLLVMPPPEPRVDDASQR